MRTIVIVFLFLYPFILLGQHEIKKHKEIKIEVKETKFNQKKPELKPAYPTEEYLKINNVPDDFPRYIDTGNPKEDAARYHEAKQIWIRKNPDRFEKIKHLNL